MGRSLVATTLGILFVLSALGVGEFAPAYGLFFGILGALFLVTAPLIVDGGRNER